MSHFTKVQTELRHAEYLIKALHAHGAVEKVLENSEVRGWQGKKKRAEIAAILQGKYDVGFNQNADGNYEAEADWSMMGRKLASDFMNEVKRRYALELVTAETAKRGFTIGQQTEKENGEVVLVVRKW